MKRDLVHEILKKKPGLKEEGLRVTLSRIKRREDLKSIEQAACYYIKKNDLKINVSSAIDDVTRQTLERHRIRRVHSVPKLDETPSRTRRSHFPKINWLEDHYYSLADRLSDFYGYLFLFENALRAKIDSLMEANYPNWWETKIKNELFAVYKYADDRRTERERLPMVAQPEILRPLDLVSLGHLEQIVVKYNQLFVPTIFPNLGFFAGNLEIPKRVRNAVAHMAPSVTLRDIRNARHGIDILLQHLSTK